MNARIVTVFRSALAARVPAALVFALWASTGSGSDTLLLNGSGSTFIHPLMSRWISAYGKRNPGVEIVYQSLGSGHGVQDALQHVVDFGATDDALTDREVASAPGLVHVPVALCGAVVAYNLPGIPALRLSPEALAGIFLGRVVRWDDPLIARDNPEQRLPSTSVFVAHRSDSSGTTAIFTRYLAAISSAWRSGPSAVQGRGRGR